MTLLERILEDRGAGVAEAGAWLLSELSANQITPAVFQGNPACLNDPPFSVPRYLAQVVSRALTGDYESVDDLADSLLALSERNLPTLEPGRHHHSERTVIPEARVIELHPPSRMADGYWKAGIVALVTSGELSGQEIEIHFDSRENRSVCFLTSCLWTHASIAAYNLISAAGGAHQQGHIRTFTSCPSTFIVIEPLRQINVTSVARSLHCSKPQLDQIRRGKGDTTIQTLKGTLVHAVFDRMLEGARDLGQLCDDALSRFGVQIASVVDDFFDEGAFRADVMRHLVALETFLKLHPHLLENPQIELKRYSATLGIQGRIDALFHQGNRIDILELKTGARVRFEDHAQLFIYRLLLSDMVRRWQRGAGGEVEITARLLSSVDGGFSPLNIQTDFHQVIDARNRLIATQRALSQESPHFRFRYEGFNEDVCGSCASWVRRSCRESTSLFGDRPGSEVTPELQYFRRFTALLERERWSADRDIADLLDDSRIEFRRRNFRMLSGGQIVPGSDPFTFSIEENTSDLAAGDAVLIHTGCISSMPIYHGHVRHVATGSIRVSIPLKNLTTEVFAGRSWNIDRLPSDMTTEASHTALYDFLRSPADSRKAAILGLPVPISTLRATAPSPEEDACPDSDFNESQRKAISRSVACDVFHLIWGPPGTGKTKVIPEIVQRVVKKGRVLLGAFTNTAVDKMLMALVSANPAISFLRIGRAADSPELAALVKDPSEHFSEDLALKHRSIHAIRRAMDSASVVAATAHRASTMPYLRQRSFEMTIVDEAGQLTEPLTLGLILRGRRFVLIGDDRQLPPVVRTRALATSMFERLKAECDAGGSRNLTLLDTQYRMHPQIMSVSNRLFYDGRLRSGVAHDQRLPPAGVDGPPVQMIPVSTGTVPGSGGERLNAAEADAVSGLVRRYLAGGVPSHAIGVISPFRAQVVLLRKVLEDTGITVDTVERFQGGEREIMILSFVRPQGRGFVFDERRFNVAMTRARRKLVLVAHPELFRNSRYEWICTFIETHRTAGMT